MPLADLLMERFKVKTRAVENPLALTSATTTAQRILGNNPNRLGYKIVCLGSYDCYVGLTDQVSATNGIKIDKSGGAVGAVWNEDFQLTGWALWIIAPDGDSAVYALEVVEY